MAGALASRRSSNKSSLARKSIGAMVVKASLLLSHSHVTARPFSALNSCIALFVLRHRNPNHSISLFQRDKNVHLVNFSVTYDALLTQVVLASSMHHSLFHSSNYCF